MEGESGTAATQRLVLSGPESDPGRTQAVQGSFLCLRDVMRELIPLPSEASWAAPRGHGKPVSWPPGEGELLA